ncbi:MFS monocarboxylate transporter, putative [Talaromyces stipitatus ATCC 10500]|uniref:MFS monocarboxylate transporter, putative n=1 Tax=Talaromyces stipitatus (strain ATCC 10500 / CBS 375.48 / QM 6759 / NRRL 1006) TaxID=441959 RepID=B8MNZ0_TALSN|nr:MFS monocarboxylate transporter, putative [Talaromyces stipitatus ATCC 10500]EED14229.1 MFS monocarboxylate transporter, putative [Talaromyces stipitatus ATCC 10500]
MSNSDIGWIGAINNFLIFAGSVVTGRILDMFGPVVMLWFGSVTTVFSIMMISLCKEYWQFILSQGVLLGIGNTLLLCPAVALVGQYFKKRLALAVGVTIAGSSLGGVIWPVVVHALIQKPGVGFGWTLRIAGFIMIPILVFTCVFSRPLLTPKKMPDDGTDNGANPSKPAWDWSIIARKQTLFTACGFFFIYFGMFMPFFYTTEYALSKGFSSNLSFYTVSIINGASLFGRIIPGMIADKYGRFNLCIAMTVFSGIISLCWTTVTSVAGIVMFSLSYGFSSGGILSLQQACAAQIASPTTIGTVIGFVMASTSFSALAGTPIGGALIENYGYLSLSIYSGVSMLLGASVLFIAKLTQKSQPFAIV